MLHYATVCLVMLLCVSCTGFDPDRLKEDIASSYSRTDTTFPITGLAMDDPDIGRLSGHLRNKTVWVVLPGDSNTLIKILPGQITGITEVDLSEAELNEKIRSVEERYSSLPPFSIYKRDSAQIPRSLLLARSLEFYDRSMHYYDDPLLLSLSDLDAVIDISAHELYRKPDTAKSLLAVLGVGALVFAVFVGIFILCCLEFNFLGT